MSIEMDVQNFVRSGIRTHASKWRPEHSYAETAQAMLESGALDRSAILTWSPLEINSSIQSVAWKSLPLHEWRVYFDRFPNWSFKLGLSLVLYYAIRLVEKLNRPSFENPGNLSID